MKGKKKKTDSSSAGMAVSTDCSKPVARLKIFHNGLTVREQS